MKNKHELKPEERSTTKEPVVVVCLCGLAMKEVGDAVCVVLMQCVSKAKHCQLSGYGS